MGAEPHIAITPIRMHVDMCHEESYTSYLVFIILETAKFPFMQAQTSSILCHPATSLSHTAIELSRMGC